MRLEEIINKTKKAIAPLVTAAIINLIPYQANAMLLETYENNNETLTSNVPSNKEIINDAKNISIKLKRRFTPENLIYLTRLVYFETDVKADGADYEKEASAISHVIKNRYDFDNSKYENIVNNKKITNVKNIKRFGDGTLMSIISNHRKFNALKDKKEYFTSSSFKDERKRHNILHGTKRYNYVLLRDKELKSKMATCYNAAKDSLLQLSEDPTNGALYYKNPKFSTAKDAPKKEAHMMTQQEKSFKNVNIDGKLYKNCKTTVEYNYYIKPSVIIGQHHFYNAYIKKSEVNWCKNKVKITRE